LGALTVEGIPRGRYRLIEQKDAEKLGKFDTGAEGKEERKESFTQRAQRTQRTQRRERKKPV
jgi:hypothetical protein